MVSAARLRFELVMTGLRIARGKAGQESNQNRTQALGQPKDGGGKKSAGETMCGNPRCLPSGRSLGTS
jgi:hypothetical protein